MKHTIFLVNLIIIIVLSIISCDGKTKRIQKMQETISAVEMDRSENRREQFLKGIIYKKPIAVIEELEKNYNTAYELYLRIEALPYKSYIGNDMSNDEYNKLTNEERRAMNEANDKIEQENEQRTQLVKQYNQLTSEYRNLIRDNEIDLLQIQMNDIMFDKDNEIDIIKDLPLILDPARQLHWETITKSVGIATEDTIRSVNKFLQAAERPILENDNIEDE